MSTQWDERLTTDELQGLLSAWGIVVTSDSPLAGLPPPSGASVEATLGARGLFDPRWQGALRVLRRPTVGIRCFTAWPRETSVRAYYGSSDGEAAGLVGCWPEPPRMRVRFPYTTEQLVETSAELVCADLKLEDRFTADHLAPGDVAALAAAVDVLRGRYFETMTERLGLEVVADLSRDDLQRALDAGRTGIDARWVVTLLRLLMPAGAPLPEGITEPSLQVLARAGLLEPRGAQWRATATLCRLAGCLRTPLPAIALEAVAAGGPSDQAYDHLIAIRGEGPLWTLDVRVDGPGQASLALRSLQGDAFRQRVSRLCAVATTGVRARRAAARTERGPCASCGSELRPGARFCHACGARLDAPEPAQPRSRGPACDGLRKSSGAR